MASEKLERLPTARQLETLRLVADGHPYSEIAQMLCISIETIDSRLQKARAIVGVRTNVELVSFAFRKGIFPIDQTALLERRLERIALEVAELAALIRGSPHESL